MSGSNACTWPRKPGPDWTYVAIIAVSSALGGRIGRRLAPVLLRGVIVVVGVAALAKFVLT